MPIKLSEPGIICFLFSVRYWNHEEIKEAYHEGIKLFSDLYGSKNNEETFDFNLVQDEDGFERFMLKAKGKMTVLVPMSGGVQPWMLKIGKAARFTVIAQGYYKGFFSEHTQEMMVEKNAPPALTDAYAVLRRIGVEVGLAYTKKQVFDLLKACDVLTDLKKSIILFTGEPEPWVISSVRNGKRIEEKFGIHTKTITLEELEKRYYEANAVETAGYARDWPERAEYMSEPHLEDVEKAAALQWAIIDLLKEHKADCFCAKCFELIGRINTTACLALSFLNGSSAWCGACEGDLDSAVSLMVMKKLTGKQPWMANPIVMDKNKLILAHCSAPVTGEESYTYRLRSHHESGTGVSTEVIMPVQRTVTLMRIGNNMDNIQFFTGTAESQPDIKTCRTRLQIHVEQLDEHIEKTLGCHYIMVYGDVTEQLRIFSKLAKLDIVSL